MTQPRRHCFHIINHDQRGPHHRYINHHNCNPDNDVSTVHHKINPHSRARNIGAKASTSRQQRALGGPPRQQY